MYLYTSWLVQAHIESGHHSSNTRGFEFVAWEALPHTARVYLQHLDTDNDAPGQCVVR
jgi:hypothetical protein